MHHIKTDARREAWKDPKNLFGRYQRSTHVERRRPDEDALQPPRRAATDPPLRRPAEENPDVSGHTAQVESASTKQKLQEIDIKRIHSTSNADVDHDMEASTISSSLTPLGKIDLWSWIWMSSLTNAIYLLFAFVPAGFALNHVHAESTKVFSVNLIAMIPSAVLLERATEVVEEVGDIVGGIFSTTFSNATLLISSIFLLKSQQLRVLQDKKEEEQDQQAIDDKEAEVPKSSKQQKLYTILAGTALVSVCTTVLAFNTEFATNSIQGVLQQHGISQMFVGFVILPLVSNDRLSVLTAVSDKMNYSLSLTLGRCMQTSMMVVPLVVMIGWAMDRSFSLEFDGFSIAALFASMIMVSYVVQEGRSNWLVSALLIKAYVIIGLAAFYIH